MLLWSIHTAAGHHDQALRLLRPFEQETRDREGPDSMRHVEVQLCHALALLHLQREPAALTTLQRTFRTHRAASMLGIPRIRERLAYFVQGLGPAKMQRYCTGHRALRDVCKALQRV
jgi:hypothetical protein